MLQQQSTGVFLCAQDVYLREVRWIPQLTEGEETSLLQCLTSGLGIQQARDRLIEGYQGLVIAFARRFERKCRFLEFLDLVQEGNEGLLQAITGYPACKEQSPFRLFVIAWIRGKMLTAIWQNERFIRLPFDKVRAIRRMATVNTQLLTELGREPSYAETARAMGLKERDVSELVVLQEQQVMSLQALPSGDDDLSLEETLADPATTSSISDHFSALDAALESLPERERLVVKLRYGFTDGQAYSQKEVASLLGVALSTIAALDRRAQLRLCKALSA